MATAAISHSGSSRSKNRIIHFTHMPVAMNFLVAWTRTVSGTESVAQTDSSVTFSGNDLLAKIAAN